MTVSQAAPLGSRPILHAVAIAVLTMLIACSPAPSASEPPSTEQQAVPASEKSATVAKAQVPMEAFVRAYVEASRSGGHPIDANFRLPAIWVFSSDGQLSQKILSDAELSSWSSAEAGTSQVAKSPAMPLSTFTRVLREKFDVTVPAVTGQQSTALVLLSNKGCEDTCPLYARTASELASRRPEALRTVTLTLTR